MREAPKTALIVAGTVLLTLLSLIAHVVAVFAGYGAAAPPLQHAALLALEAAWHTITNGG